MKQINIRLNEETEHALFKTQGKLRRDQQEIVRDAILYYSNMVQNAKTFLEVDGWKETEEKNDG